MKKLQMIPLLILARFLMFSCVPDEDDDEDFLDNDQSHTVSDGENDTTDDTLPDSQTETEPTNPTTEPTTEPTNPTDPTEPTEPTNPTEPTTEPTDDSDMQSTDNDAVPVSDNDSEEPSTSDNDILPEADNDNEILNDEDNENPSDNDSTDNDGEPEADIDLTDNDIQTDNDTEPSTGLPECNENKHTPCVDHATGYIWSDVSFEQGSWQSNDNRCSGLMTKVNGKSVTWRLPTITELRTLVKDCAGSKYPGGTCRVSDIQPVCLNQGCFDLNDCECSSDDDGGHSKFGETLMLWSSSAVSTDDAWVIYFGTAMVRSYNKNYTDVRSRCIYIPEN